MATAPPRSNGTASLERLADDLAAGDPEVVDAAVRRLGRRLRGMPAADYRRAVEMLCSLSYIDTADRPEFGPTLERVGALLGRQGTRAIPVLLAQLEGSDLKSHTFLARSLARMGERALSSLRDLLATAEDPYARSFALYAIGKMTCPAVVRALPEVIGSLLHPDREVRDSAARTLGKIANAAPARRLTARRRREMFEGLLRAARDPQPAVRAKAYRSLGKMAAAGLLREEQRRAMEAYARAAVGDSEVHRWDHAYVVRREAREALEAVVGGTRSRP